MKIQAPFQGVCFFRLQYNDMEAYCRSRTILQMLANEMSPPRCPVDSEDPEDSLSVDTNSLDRFDGLPPSNRHGSKMAPPCGRHSSS